ncbi:MAG: NADH-quinone oxidoreductase subunit M, partial [Actinomycetota bacterium]|nr:NADH-quinone oxidoreductase subunit M [Actinomycetota bacterium]
AMPGSANFVGEFYILLGVFQDKPVYAILAFAGVALASVYTLRLFIRAMHNRVGPRVESADLKVSDGLVLVPLVLAILAVALYPQLPLEKGEKTVIASVASARDLAGPPAAAGATPVAEPPKAISGAAAWMEAAAAAQAAAASGGAPAVEEAPTP